MKTNIPSVIQPPEIFEFVFQCPGCAEIKEWPGALTLHSVRTEKQPPVYLLTLIAQPHLTLNQDVCRMLSWVLGNDDPKLAA